MREHQQPEPPHRSRRFQVGDPVRIVQGPDRDRSGVIVSIDPASARPYLVKFNEHWYIHFAADRLAPAPHWPHAIEQDAAASH